MARGATATRYAVIVPQDTPFAHGRAAQRVADLDAHPERRLHEGIDLLADTWLPNTGGFVYSGQLARSWIGRALAAVHERELIAAASCIEVHVRSWQAARPDAPAGLCASASASAP